MSTTSSDAPPGTSPPGPPHDVALEQVLAEGLERARATGPGQLALWTALRDATRGGKRFRPALVAAAHDALGGTEAEAAARVGAAVELLHTAFVVHDDVIDGDQVRRGRPNVSGTFGRRAADDGATAAAAAHLGLTAGILAGDLALAAAIRTVATCDVPPTTVARLLDLFDRALHTTAAGELDDVAFTLGTRAPSLGEALTMEEQKTSAYSFELPLQAGAVLAGADDEVVRRLGEAARMLGVAFQLRDDLLGVFGDPRVTGKSALTDLREGKQTPLIAYARTTELWEGVAAHLGSPDLTADDADIVRCLLVESGARDFVEGLADDYVRGARTLLDEAGLPLEQLRLLALVVPQVGRAA
ncbi:polyprenyl synthetase family protein [Nocardioides caldifontis]|uniref:polyprenyl synthetase family protein n=1 Tax=Nocardioides caldifontis TaxID=2588938 RepID=UPI0011DF55B7|nr:polyprenyl synthetase family protein [Nocardioides caldifontis]